MSKKYIVILLMLAMTLPLFADIMLTQNFDGVTPPTLPSGWLVKDYNADGKTWALTTSHPRSLPNCFRYNYNRTVAAKDWFFSNGVTLQAGITYTLEFFYDASNPTFPERLRVWLTTSQDSSGKVGSPIWNNGSIMNTVFAQGLADFTPTSTQTYYLGFECYSPMNMWNLRIDDITLYKDVHDVAVDTIMPPPTSGQVYTLNSVIIPKVVVHNYGQNTGGEYTPVHVEVVGLPSSVEWFRDTMVRLEICTPETLTFPPCTLKIPCNHRLSAWTALANDQDRSNDTASVDFLVNARDVQVYKIIIPRDTMLWCTESIPTDTVKNLGHQTESFWVYFKSKDSSGAQEYFDSTYVSSLTSGSKQLVTFKKWHFPPCNHTAISYTAMPGDENVHNDSVTKPYVIKYYDISADTILGVPDTIQYCTTLNDSVVIHSHSRHVTGQDGWVFANYYWNTLLKEHDSVYVSNLLPGQRYVAHLPQYHPDTACNWSVKAWVKFANEQNLLNDTVVKNFVVKYYDVSADSILGIPDTIQYCTTLYDTVVIRNHSVHIVSQTGKVYINYYRNAALMKSDSVTGITLAYNERKAIPFSYHPDSSCNWKAIAWVSFPFDQNPMNDTVRKNFVVKYYDVSADSILGIPDTIQYCTTLYDTVVIRNHSDHIVSQTGKVYINYYRNAALMKSDSATGITLTANERKAIPFSYHPDSSCNWSIKAWVVFPLDQNPANDTARKNFVVKYYDIGAVSILDVPDTMQWCNTIYPKVVIHNNGVHTLAQNGWVFINFYRNSILRYQDSAFVTGSMPGDWDTLGFQWHPDSACNHMIKAWVKFSPDQDPTNDTVWKNFVVQYFDVEAVPPIVNLPDSINFCNTINPKIVVHNQGIHVPFQTGWVVYNVLRSHDAVTYYPVFTDSVQKTLAYCVYDTVTFSYHPDSACWHMVTATVRFNPDQNMSNNTVAKAFVVRLYDIGITNIAVTPETIEYCNTVSCSVAIRNNGIHTGAQPIHLTVRLYRNGNYINTPLTADWLGVLADSTVWAKIVIHPDSACNHQFVAICSTAVDNNPHNDTAIANFVVTYHDVEAVSLLNVPDTLLVGDQIHAKFVVHNKGIHVPTQTGWVHFDIYRDTAPYMHIVYRDSVQKTLDYCVYDTVPFTWTADSFCNHKVFAYVAFSPDQVRSNDTLSQSFVVRYRDVAVDSISIPRDTVRSCTLWTPAIHVKNNGIHVGGELCTLNLKIWRYKVKMDSLCHISPDTTKAIVAYDQSVVITIYPTSGDTTIYLPQWHPYWSDVYYVGQHHHMTATIHMTGDQNPANDQLSKNFIVKARDHDLQTNYVGLLHGNTVVTIDTVIVGVAYNPVSVVSISPSGPAASFRSWYKVYRVKDGVVVYSRYLDKTLLPVVPYYACLYYQSGWVPNDSGFYIVSSWIQTRPGVDLLPENDSMKRTFYAKLTSDKSGQGQQGERVNTLPTVFALQQNYPNPFFRTTAIRWQVPSASDVVISVYDASGRNIKTLVNGKFVPGYYNTIWDCTNGHNQKVAAGIYFYEMRTSSYTSRLKMVIAH